MPKRKHTAEEIINKLKEAEVIIAAGSAVVEAASCIGISEQTFCRWQAEYGGLRVDQARCLGLGEQVDSHVDLVDAPGRANAGDKMLALAASALAAGDCIDDADALCVGGTAGAVGCAAKAPSTLGTSLRSFRWGHVRQLGRVSRELLMRSRAAGAGPGCGSLTIDIDSTVCETHGMAKKGARRHNYAGQRGYRPLLASAGGTGDVLMVRLRKGRAITARGADHFLGETVGRACYAGTTG